MGKLVSSTYSSRTYVEDEYQIKELWNSKKACKFYALYRKYKICRDGWGMPDYEWRKVSTSEDRAWAERNAEHYKIEIKDLES